MKKIFVVVDTDAQRAIRGFVSEARADDHADKYYEETGHDSRVDEVWFDETEEELED